MEMQKKSILLYLDMLPMLESLPPASCGKVVLALLRYAADGKPPKGFRGAEKMALEFIRAQIDRDTEKYRLRCEANRKNALRRVQKTAAMAGEGTPPQTIAADTDTEKDTEKEKDTDTETDIDTEKDTDTEAANRQEEGNPPEGCPSCEELEPYRQIFLCECPSLPRLEEVSLWTPKRRAMLRQAEMEPEEFAALCRRVEESDFLTGRSGKWTGCSFDWLLQEENRKKVMQGCYDSVPRKEKRPAPSFDLEEYERMSGFGGYHI